MKSEIEYDKILEELKVIQNRLSAIQGLIVKKLQEEMNEKMIKFEKNKVKK